MEEQKVICLGQYFSELTPDNFQVVLDFPMREAPIPH